MKMRWMKRLGAATLAVAGMVGLVAGPAQAATYTYSIECGYWTWVDPATAPGAHDLLMRPCLQLRRDTSSSATYLRTWSQFKLADGVCCSRGVYYRTWMWFDDPAGNRTEWRSDPSSDGDQYVITQSAGTVTIYGYWKRTGSYNHGAGRTLIEAARNASYTESVFQSAPHGIDTWMNF